MFVECDDCDLVYLKNRPTLETLPIIYPQNYYTYHRSLGSFIGRIRSFVQRGKARKMRQYLSPGAVVVDVGCGTGELLKSLRTIGGSEWRLIGVDMSNEAIVQLGSDGIEGRVGRFEELDWNDELPDVIIMNQVIEHLEDPRASVKQAFRLLKPGGRIVVETPSVDAWDARLFRKRFWGGWHCPRHWNLYSADTLARLLREQGFEILTTTFLMNPYGWTHSFQNLVAVGFTSPRAAGLFSERVFPFLALCCAIDVVQKGVRGKTSNMRMVARKPHTPASVG